jgi:hypothetical protein
MSKKIKVTQFQRAAGDISLHAKVVEALTAPLLHTLFCR